MGIKVGINGFGRIGRVVSRACLQNSELHLSAINDPAISVEYISYLLKFDSTHGKLNRNITHTDNEIIIDDHHIKVFREKLPLSIPWHSAGVQYVIEASGMYTSHEKAAGHLLSEGVKRVIVTAPSADIPMIILGVNDCTLTRECKIISCASSTLYCLAPIIKVLDDSFGVEEGFITSIHAMTPSLKPLDGLCLRGRHWRDHRSIHQNIIPASTGACKALGKILPQVKDKLTGLAFRVPIVNVSVLDLSIRLQANTTLKEIIKSIQEASKTILSNIIKVTNEESVSSDFIGETSSCIFDEKSSLQLNPNFFKCVCWYENEYSYALRVVDTIIYSENQIYLEFPDRLSNVRRFLMKHNVPQQTESSQSEKSTAFMIGINSEIVGSVSQDTGVKIRSSPALINAKHISSAEPASKMGTKTEELSKLTKNNDFCERPRPSVINRCSFYQSCLGFSQQAHKKIDCNTQARLENVKKEFTKMVSVTENLLKKPYNSQSNRRTTSVDELMCLKGFDFKSKDDIVRKGPKGCTKSENKSLVEKCGDFKSSIDVSNAIQQQNGHCNDNDDTASLKLQEIEKLENSDCTSNMNIGSQNLIDITESELDRNNENNDKQYLIKNGIERYNEELVRPEKESEFKEITKAYTTLVDGLSQNRKVRCVWDDYKIEAIPLDLRKNKISGETPKNANNFFSKSISSNLLLQKETKDMPQINNIENKVYETAIQMKINNSTVGKNIIHIEEVLRKRNIILVDSKLVTEQKSEYSNQENDASIAEIDEKIKNTHSSEQTEEGLTCKTKNILIEGTTKSSPEDTQTMSNVEYESLQDIYDKLDSGSDTNSNKSLEINEKKSQVIQIADLTNSIEDIARLDKICRIIEISDELSDKLFSALDESGQGLKKQRWSFKDLCARIKLDEFCNKVFSGNAV